MNRNLFRSCTTAVALAFLAACGDNAMAPKTGVAPSMPDFALNTPENGPGQCMGDDAFEFGLNGMASGADLNCTSKDVRIAKTIITSYSLDNITFTPLGENDRVACVPGDVIYARTSALVVGGAQSRWDVGVWIATDEGTAVTGQCDHFNLVTPNNDESIGDIFSQGVTNLDSDSCGDLTQGDTARVVLGLRTFQCEGTEANPNVVSVGACLGWLNSVDPGSRTSSVCPITPPGGADGFRFGTTPETKAKCNCDPLVLPIDIKGVLNIVKQTVPDGDATSFGFTTTGTGYTTPFSLSDGQSNGSGPLSTGTYTATETVPTGWTLAAPVCVFTGTTDPADFTTTTNGVSVDLATGENVTCTFTNTKNSSVTIIKDAVPNDAQNFAFTSDIANCTAFSLDDDSDNTLSNTKVCPVAAGTYSVSETVPADWTQTSATCDDGSPVTAIDVAAGENVTCTFTNTKSSSVTIVKDAVPNDPQDFAFTGNITACTSFSLDDDSDNTLSNTKTCAVAAGTYNVAETVPSGWTQTSATCDDGSPITAIDVAAGENVTCTFTNTKNSSITIIKDALPNDPQNFSFAGNITNCTAFTLDDDSDGILSNTQVCPVAAGTYNVAETVPTGWVQTSATCDDGSPITAINVAAGENVTCTFTNTKQARLRIVKETNPDGNTTAFTFTPTNWNGGSTFTRADNQEAFVSDYLAPGATVYSTAETVPAGWSLTGRACVYTGTSTAKTKSDITNGVSLTLAAGEDVTCTFSNTALSTIIIEKELVGGGTQSFTFTRVKVGGGDLGDNASPTLQDGGSSSSGKKLTAGTYTVCETNLAAGYSDPTATGYTLTGDGFGNYCTNVVLGVDDSKTVHFINRVPPPSGSTRTIGYWKNWSSCSQSSGGQYDKAIKNGTPQGTLDYYLGGAGITSIYPIGSITTLTCNQAVNLLSKSNINGKKMSGDPIYNMVAQLLGAKLNIASSAGSCTALNDALPLAQALLEAIGFDGIKGYSNKNSLTTTQANLANSLAATFAKYNEGTLGGGCPTHV